MKVKHAILYVDDEVDNLDVFKAVFRHDYNVITASTPGMGMYLLRQNPVSLVISDYKMPEKNGIDFFKEIITEFPQVNRILLTAYSESDIVITSVNEVRVFALVTKPWKKEELKIIINNAVLNFESKIQSNE